MGLFGDKDAIVFTAVNMSRGKDGVPDPYKAAGIAMGASLGSGKDWTFSDTCRLGGILGAMGSFDKKKDGNNSNPFL